MSRITVDFPFTHITDPETGRNLGLGNAYFGVIDGNPYGNPADRVNVYAVQPDGSELLVSQPIQISATGIAVVGGSPVQLRVDSEYSLDVRSFIGAQVYYAARVASWEKSVDNRITDLSNTITANKLYDTVAAMTAGINTAGEIVRCHKYQSSSTVWPNLIYLSRGTGWPIVADGYVNHIDAGGNFLELLYDVLDVRQAGAYGDGVTYDGAYVQKAIDFLATKGGGELLFSRGTFKINQINLPQHDFIIRGNDAKLIPQTTSTQYGLCKLSRGGYTEIRDLDFQGFNRGIYIDMPTSEEMFYDFLIVNCKFTQIAAEGWGIYLDGPREGNIDKCYFESTGQGSTSGGGIYRTLVVNTNIRDCIFKEARFGVYDDGQGSPYSAGNHLLGCVMLGVNFGVTASRNDSYVIDGCMIDYCDAPIRLFSQDGAKIVNNYISTRTANPAIDVKKDPGDAVGNFGVKIINNTIISHYTAGPANTIEIFDSQDSTISDCYIQFYNFYGIRYKNCTFLTIDRNKFDPRPGTPYTPVCIANPDNDGNISNKAIYNSFSGVALIPASQNIIARHNYGLVTQAYGFAAMPAGATTVTVTHGMSIAPAIVILSPQANNDFWWDLDGVTGINIRSNSTSGSIRYIPWVAYTAYAITN